LAKRKYFNRFVFQTILSIVWKTKHLNLAAGATRGKNSSNRHPFSGKVIFGVQGRIFDKKL